MSETIIIQSGVQDKVMAWDSIFRHPPINEVETLRVLEKIKEEQSLNQASDRVFLSKLYTIAAYYRVQRGKYKNKITETILSQAKKIHPENDLVKSLELTISLYSFYQLWNEIELETWMLRETDFDPVKIRKISDLEVQLSSLYDSGSEISFQDQKEMLELEDLFHQSLAGINDFIELLQQSESSLQNKKVSLPVNELNQSAQRLAKSRNTFYQLLPEKDKLSAYDSPLNKLNQLVGMKEVKNYIREYYQYLKYQQERRDIGFSIADEPGLHMIISGNPGTGKTTIVRLLAEIYYELGLLDTNKVTEVNRSHLVGSYLGQSEENTINYVKQSLGGVLFIDEAYSLRREGQTGNDYGQAVVDTLVTSMTSNEYDREFAVILAGYPEEMRQFVWANPGLRSRFPAQNQIILPDFEPEELLTIAEAVALENDYFFTEEALGIFSDRIEQQRVDESFGNARTVKDLVLKTIFNIGKEKRSKDKDDWLEHMKISDSDLVEKNKSSQKPLEELDQLVGLREIKQEVKKLSSFVRIQQKRKSAGYAAVPIQLHAVFSGNPGTGKTTVAKIYSRILNECGLLKRGHLVIASRSDLVAGYVGQTAAKTRQKVKEALGGVLFIDEAYSLYRGEKDFGKEAIDTLVDEMTKHNENLVIVMAGYEREMEQFINSNPGLQSRFKKYFHFTDYNAEELVEITDYRTELYQYETEETALMYLKQQYDRTAVTGNARFVANLVDEAIQFQGWRLMEGNQEITSKDLQLLTEEDVEQAWKAVKGKKT